jgi:uncharacterized protein
MLNINTQLIDIKNIAEEKLVENDEFILHLKKMDGKIVDENVQALDAAIAPQIDCTTCGNCCKSFMINVSEEEAINVADELQLSLPTFKTNYLEESQQGRLIMKSIPCSFLAENKCTIYDKRFSGCREFPHLHQPNFNQRLFSIFMYYPTCPIIFNVIENLKTTTNFIGTKN